mgnify:CR=1 FL=1
MIHLYGHHGTHLEHNAGRKPFEELRKLLVERGYWLVVPNLGLSHWMNDEAVENVDRVIDQMVSSSSLVRAHERIAKIPKLGTTCPAYSCATNANGRSAVT